MLVDSIFQVMDYPLENKRAELSFINIVFAFEEVSGVGWQSLGHVYVMAHLEEEAIEYWGLLVFK